MVAWKDSPTGIPEYRAVSSKIVKLSVKSDPCFRYRSVPADYPFFPEESRRDRQKNCCRIVGGSSRARPLLLKIITNDDPAS